MRQRTQQAVATTIELRVHGHYIDAGGFGSADITQTAEVPAVARPPASGSVTPAAAPLQLRDAARYEMIGEHGRGGLGRVLRAHDKELGRDIAIKELLERTHTSEVRFFREALITARLEHPNIVPVHEAGRWADGTPFYAMKLVSGRPLKQLIDAATTLADRLAILPNVIAVIDAIAYAHDHRVIHRDLKPANVIVGEFGETVVIDWGLAKVLDEPEVADPTPYRTAARDELTAAGSALGTPAYMAPEQHAGKSDERSDIYALGGILYQVLTGTTPNEGGTYPPQTPRDLVAIVDRAMAKNPEHRYPRAMALGDDLRRFVRRERVSARRYSLPARIALFTARHKTFAVMLVAGLVALTITLAITLAKIADQRADAFAARNEADFARKRAETAKDALTLKHVELLMKSDPTAALQALGDYHGLDETRRRQLEAEALGRGVAREVMTPHNDTIHAAFLDAEGAVISIAEDRKIQRTLRGTTTTLASDVANTVRYARSPSLFAYAIAPAGVALLDLKTRAITKLTSTGAPESLAFSPDGTRLAVIDHEGSLRVWSLTPIASAMRDDKVADPIAVAFAGSSRVVVWHAGGLRSLDLERGTSQNVTADASADDVPDRARLATDDHRILLGARDGMVTLYSPRLEKVAALEACKSAVRAVQMLDGDRIAFACRDGAAGIASATLAIEQRFAFPAPISVFAIDAGGTLAAGASDTTLYLHDLRTGMASHRDGHGAPIAAISLGTTIVTADVLGAIRTWARPSGAARVLTQLPTDLRSVYFAPDGRTLAAYGRDGVVRLLDLHGRPIRELRGHTAIVEMALFSDDGETITTMSEDRTARTWRRSDGTPLRVFAAHHAVINDFGYLDPHTVVSAGADGTLRRWSTTGDDDVVLFRRPMPLVVAEILETTGMVVVLDAGGSVWRVARDGTSLSLRPAGTDPASIVKASPDRTLVAVGTEGGHVTVYRASDWTIVGAMTTTVTIANIRFDPRNRDALINSTDGHLHVLSLGSAPRLPWSEPALRAMDMRYSADGSVLAIAAVDGTTWLFEATHGRWAYTHDHAGDLHQARFTPDGKSLFTIDGSGTIVARDVGGTFAESSN